MRAVGTVSRAGQEQARTKGERAGAVWQCNWSLAQVESALEGKVEALSRCAAWCVPHSHRKLRQANAAASCVAPKPTLALAAHWCHAPTQSRSCYHGSATIVPSSLPSCARVASSS